MSVQSLSTVWTFACPSGLKGSLQRMQLEYVDVVFANRPDSNTPMEGESAYRHSTLYKWVIKALDTGRGCWCFLWPCCIAAQQSELARLTQCTVHKYEHLNEAAQWIVGISVWKCENIHFRAASVSGVMSSRCRFGEFCQQRRANHILTGHF